MVKNLPAKINHFISIILAKTRQRDKWNAFLFCLGPGSQASSRGEAKDSALLSSHDAGLLEPSVHGIFQARILEWVVIAFSIIS